MALLAAAAASCTAPGRAPVIDRSLAPERPAAYTVRRNDTLYSIAWRHDLDYRALAAANGIVPPYLIRVGQRIRLTERAAPPARRAAAMPQRQARVRPRETSGKAAPNPAPAATPPKRPPAPPPAQTRPPPIATATLAGSAWRRPVPVDPVRRFGGNSKGFDYNLQPATRIRAAASGIVVYAGPGLGGLKHLVIVKHSDRYLVAYGCNVPPALREGQRVRAGAVVAEIAPGDPTAGRFHFEIRDRGKPVDPASLIGR